ncbi:Rho-binding antiterminator [Vibrio sp. RC27]
MIDCNEYDYIELSCLYRFPVRLTMKEGDCIEGIARDTVRNASRHECIKLSSNNDDILIELESILKLEVLIDNPHFSQVTFK